MRSAAVALALLLGLLPGCRRREAPLAPPEAPGTAQHLWYHTGYGGGLRGPDRGMSALTGPAKMPAVFEGVLRQRLVVPGNLHTDHPGAAPPAPPIDLDSLRAVHTDRYLLALMTGAPAERALSQGLPFWSPAIARGWLLNTGGLAAAAEAALRTRSITGNLGHGYHHAGPDRGMGFCTLNGLAVVAARLVREGKARRVMILDLDQHEGNGTSLLVIGEPGIWNVTIHGTPAGGPPGAENVHPIRVAHGAFPPGRLRDLNYLAVLSARVPALVAQQGPDLILYQAGMDPYDGAGISAEALAARDAFVFALARARGIPLTWVLAGGYADRETLVDLHTGTVRAANRVLEQVAPGDRLAQGPSGDVGAWRAEAGVVTFPDWGGLLGEPPQVLEPPRLEPHQAKAWGDARRRLREVERVPEAALRAAYDRLFRQAPGP